VEVSGKKTMAINRGKVRWQCRRSLLELDLVLARFLEKDFDCLNDDQVADLEDLLRCDDYDLWAMVNGSKPCEVARWQEIVARLR
jgi:antitoxin CptB